MCQKQKNTQNTTGINTSKKKKLLSFPYKSDVVNILLICATSLFFVVILNIIWYVFELTELGLPSSLTFTEGFQLTINIIFMCVIAYLQYKVERNWNVANDNFQSFEKKLEFEEIVSNRIHDLSVSDELSTVGYIPVALSLQNVDRITNYPKSVRQFVSGSEYDLLIYIESPGQQSIFPACYHFENLKLKISSEKDYSNANEIQERNICYKNSCLWFGINALDCNEKVKERIFSNLVNALYFNQKGRQADELYCQLTATVTDNSHRAYDVKTQTISPTENLSFNLIIDFSLLPASGFCDAFGKFKLRMRIRNIKVSAA